MEEGLPSVGDRLDIWWPTDNAYYTGTATTAIGKTRHKFHVDYDDGDQFDENLNELRWRHAVNLPQRHISSDWFDPGDAAEMSQILSDSAFIADSKPTTTPARYAPLPRRARRSPPRTMPPAHTDAHVPPPPERPADRKRKRRTSPCSARETGSPLSISNSDITRDAAQPRAQTIMQPRPASLPKLPGLPARPFFRCEHGVPVLGACIGVDAAADMRLGAPFELAAPSSVRASEAGGAVAAFATELMPRSSLPPLPLNDLAFGLDHSLRYASPVSTTPASMPLGCPRAAADPADPADPASDSAFVQLDDASDGFWSSSELRAPYRKRFKKFHHMFVTGR